MGQTLRILWVCGSRVIGGAERATLQIAAELSRRGHVLHALCPPDDALTALIAAHGIGYSVRPLGRAFDLRAHHAIRKGALHIDAQVVLVTTVHEWVWSCLGAARSAALVLARHMDLPLNPRLARLAARRADAIVAVSDAVRATLVERNGLADRLVRVIHNPTRYPPRPQPPDAEARRQARQQMGLRGDGPWVGFFGGFDPGKGLDDALRAVRLAAETLGPVQVLVARRGTRWRSDAAADRARLSAAGLGDRLHVVGEIDDMATAFGAVDATLIATRRELGEALPLTAIESLACGTPVVAYRVGGVAEVLGESGEAGCLATADDSDDLARQLAGLLAAPERAAQLAAAGLERARTLFSAPRIADQYEQLFNELATARRRG